MHSRTSIAHVRRALSASGLVLVLLGAAACGGTSDEPDAATGQASPSPSQQQDPADKSTKGPEADLSDVPDVVAVVNGQEISKREFAEIYRPQLQRSAQGGAPVDQNRLKQQIVQSLVSTELLSQAAEKRDLTASEKEVDQRLEELAGQNGMKSSDQLVQALEGQGLDEAAVREQIGTQVAVEKLVTAVGGDTAPTDQEVRSYYDQLKAQQQAAPKGKGGEVPPLKQVRAQIVEQLTSQKQAEVADRLVKQYRKNGDVTVNL